MAKLSKFAIFFRAFIVALVATNAGRSTAQSSDEDGLWERTLQIDNVEAYHNYLSNHPDGEHVLEAVGALRRLGAFGEAPATRSGLGSVEGDLY